MSNAAIQSLSTDSARSTVSRPHAVPAGEGEEILTGARARGAAAGLPYAGGIEPADAWQLFASGVAVILDVRTAEERKFVGHVPDSLHVAWATGTAMTRNPRFVREVEAKVGKDSVLLLLCRSSKRSAAAAEVLAKAGYANVFNVLEGFEGELDARQQRGAEDGWRHRGLPWIQD